MVFVLDGVCSFEFVGCIADQGVLPVEKEPEEPEHSGDGEQSAIVRRRSELDQRAREDKLHSSSCSPESELHCESQSLWVRATGEA